MKHLFLPSAVMQSCLPVLFRYSAIFVFVFFFFKLASASMVLQTVKNRPTRWETLVRSLGQEDPMEKEMASHFSILMWRNPMDRGAWWATVHGVTKSRP